MAIAGLRRDAESAFPAAAAIVAAALLLCWPAIYNGFPLVYGDTASYLDTIDPRKTMWARQIFYTALLRPLHWRLSLWPPIFAQALITAHLLYLVLRAMQPRLAPETYLFIATILALTTSLPWHTSALLPDAFTPILLLAMFLVGFCRASLSRLETAYLVVLIAVAAIVHLSHFPLALGLIAVIVAAQLVLRLPDRRRPRTTLLLIAPIAIAASAHLAINTVVHASFSLSPASSIWLLARFIADGPARDYLREECPRRNFILCAYQDQLPNDSDEFLWSDRTADSVFSRAGGYDALRGEAREIVQGTLARHPGAVLDAFLRNSARQFVMIGTGGWINFGPGMMDKPITRYIALQFPRDYPRYVTSAQLRGTIPVAALATWHIYFVIIGAFACAILLATPLRRPLFALLLLMVLAALIGNAMVTGGISAVHDRYQTRLVWLVVFAACAGGVAYAADPTRVSHPPGARRWRRPFRHGQFG